MKFHIHNFAYKRTSTAYHIGPFPPALTIKGTALTYY